MARLPPFYMFFLPGFRDTAQDKHLETKAHAEGCLGVGTGRG
jgi:hypothetical protein